MHVLCAAIRRPRASSDTEPAPWVFCTNTETLSFVSSLLMRFGCSCANSRPPSSVPTMPSALSVPCQASVHAGAGGDDAGDGGDRHLAPGAGGAAESLPLRRRPLPLPLPMHEGRNRQAPYHGHDRFEGHVMTAAESVSGNANAGR